MSGELGFELLCDGLEIADCPLDGSPADLLPIAEVSEYRQGTGEFIAEQMAELLDVVEILR